MPTLHAEFDPPPLRGYYIFFARLDGAYTGCNFYMPNRICGDVFLLRLNEQKCEPESAGKEKCRHVVYEDAPQELTTGPLLREIIMTSEWKSLPGSDSVVRLGFSRCQEEWNVRQNLKRKRTILERTAREKRQMATFPREEQRPFTSTGEPTSHDIPIPSTEEQQPYTSTNRPRFAQLFSENRYGSKPLRRPTYRDTPVPSSGQQHP